MTDKQKEYRTNKNTYDCIFFVSTVESTLDNIISKTKSDSSKLKPFNYTHVKETDYRHVWELYHEHTKGWYNVHFNFLKISLVLISCNVYEMIIDGNIVYNNTSGGKVEYSYYKKYTSDTLPISQVLDTTCSDLFYKLLSDRMA